MPPPRTPPRPFYNNDFAAHLRDARELFADILTTIAAYPRALARQIFSHRGWPRMAALRHREQATIADVYAHLQLHYQADLGPRSGLPSGQRLRYIVNMVHFSKVRAAILYTEGL